MEFEGSGAASLNGLHLAAEPVPAAGLYRERLRPLEAEVSGELLDVEAELELGFRSKAGARSFDYREDETSPSRVSRTGCSRVQGAARSSHRAAGKAVTIRAPRLSEAHYHPARAILHVPPAPGRHPDYG